MRFKFVAIKPGSTLERVFFPARAAERQRVLIETAEKIRIEMERDEAAKAQEAILFEATKQFTTERIREGWTPWWIKSPPYCMRTKQPYYDAIEIWKSDWDRPVPCLPDKPVQDGKIGLWWRPLPHEAGQA